MHWVTVYGQIHDTNQPQESAIVEREIVWKGFNSGLQKHSQHQIEEGTGGTMCTTICKKALIKEWEEIVSVKTETWPFIVLPL